MRFTILRRFSHLIHRRTRSESALDFMSPPPPQAPDTLPWCQSFNERIQQAGDFSRYPPLNAPLLAISPVNSATAPLPDDLLLTATHVEQRTRELQNENDQLEILMKQMKHGYGLQEQELHCLKNMVASEQHQIFEAEHVIKTAEEALFQLQADITRYDESFFILLDIELCGPVFRCTRDAISSGSNFTDAVVDVIREAANKPDSPWSRLIPAVVGTRSSDQYNSALNATLKARAEVKHSRNVAQFWKNTARQDPAHTCTITPSSSTLSEVQETLSTDRQKAVDDLLQKLRSGEIPIRSTVVTQTTQEITGDSLSFHSSSNLRASPEPVGKASPSSSGSLKDASDIQLHSRASSFSNTSRIIDSQPTGLPYLRDGTAVSSLFQPHNPDLTEHKSNSSSVGASLASSASSGSTHANSSAGSEALSLLPCPDFKTRDFWAATPSTELRFSFSPEDAIESLERIYSRFTSMKLDTIDEESTQAADVTMVEQSDANTNWISIPSEGSVYGENDVTLIETSATPLKLSPSKRASKLPILSKIPRRLSLSLSPKKDSPKKNTPATPTRSLMRPTISSALKQSPPKNNAPPRVVKNVSGVRASPSLKPSIKARGLESKASPNTCPSKQNARSVRGKARKQ